VLLHRARWLSQTYKIPPEGFCVLVYTNVLTYFLRQSLDFLGIPKENVRTFDDWCAELWDQFVRKPKPRTLRIGAESHSLILQPCGLACSKVFKPSRHLVRAPASPNPTSISCWWMKGRTWMEPPTGILRLATKHLTVFADARQQIFEGGASVLENAKASQLDRPIRVTLARVSQFPGHRQTRLLFRQRLRRPQLSRHGTAETLPLRGERFGRTRWTSSRMFCANGDS